MRGWILPATIGTAVSISCAGSVCHAQGVVSGNYVRDEERSDDAFQAIERAIATLPNSKRPFIRTMLRKSIAVYRMRISTAGSRVGITYDDKAPIIAWMGGDPVKWKLIEVLVFDVSAKSNGEAISLSFRGEYSDRVMTYHAVGKDLVVDTIMRVPSISEPIAYKQIFDKTN